VNNTNTYKRISESIKSNIILLEKLLEKINEERNSIERQDLESLLDSTKEKSLAFEEVQVAFNQRIKLFEELEVPKTEKGFFSFINKLSGPQGKRLKEEWRQLSMLMNETHNATLVNQKIIHKSKENNAKVLDVLKGKRPDNNLYGKTGERKNMPYQTSLIKA
jgi:flagellar biosynthesis/type III secretory pathway chaperone